jgi:hypothetical protein
MSSLHRGNLLQEAMDRIDSLPIPMTVETQVARLAPAFPECVPWVHGLLDSYHQIAAGRSISLSMFFVQLVVVSDSIDHVAHNAIRNRARRIVARRSGRAD